MWQFADLYFADHIFLQVADLRTQIFFANLKLPKIRNYIITNISLKKLSFKFKNEFLLLV
jgi:hypothetical protein